jgi:hypothetical protein
MRQFVLLRLIIFVRFTALCRIGLPCVKVVGHAYSLRRRP